METLEAVRPYLRIPIGRRYIVQVCMLDDCGVIRPIDREHSANQRLLVAHSARGTSFETHPQIPFRQFPWLQCDSCANFDNRQGPPYSRRKGQTRKEIRPGLYRPNFRGGAVRPIFVQEYFVKADVEFCNARDLEGLNKEIKRRRVHKARSQVNSQATDPVSAVFVDGGDSRSAITSNVQIANMVEVDVCRAVKDQAVDIWVSLDMVEQGSSLELTSRGDPSGWAGVLEVDVDRAAIQFSNACQLWDLIPSLCLPNEIRVARRGGRKDSILGHQRINHLASPRLIDAVHEIRMGQTKVDDVPPCASPILSG
jgi:hypothetical protein